MRLAAQSKMGFYPASPTAIEAIGRHLVLDPEKPEKVHIIDPCAGRGAAIAQLAAGLEVPPDRVYAVELDAARGEACREALPGGNVLSPCSFHGCQVTSHSFGLAYVNPPFDGELGGGRREEYSFVMRATWLLAPRGILVLVCPFRALAGRKDFADHIDANYEDVRLYRFPDEVRDYHEIVVIGRKRRVSLTTEKVSDHGELSHMGVQWWSYFREENLAVIGTPFTPIRGGKVDYWRQEPEVATYVVPSSYARPSSFRKTNFTEEELAERVAESPLNRLLAEVVPLPPKRPPLPLAKGHVALLLASGMLDGLVEAPEGNHVVRGTARKEEYVSERTSTEDEETGAVTEKVTFSQRIVLTIRAVDASGEIHTFSDAPPKDEESDTDNEE